MISIISGNDFQSKHFTKTHMNNENIVNCGLYITKKFTLNYIYGRYEHSCKPRSIVSNH